MSAEYRINADLRVIFSTASGVLTDADLLEHQAKLLADSCFDRSFNQLWDLTEVSQVEVSSQALRTLARSRSFEASARRAVVAGDDLVFGMGRMFQMLHDEAPEEMQVFRSLDEARQWLGLDPD